MTTNSRSSQELAVDPAVLTMATAVGPRASIRDVRLTELSVQLNEANDAQTPALRWSRAFGFRRLDEMPGHVDVQISFKMEMFYESKESPKEPAASIECTYSLIYEVTEIAGLDDEHLKAFAQVNGFFNAWPFWREICSTMATRMGIGRFIVPTLRVVPAAPESKPQTPTNPQP